MPFHVTVLYAGLNGLLALILAVRVSSARTSAKVNIGSGDNPLLEQRIRAHGNAIENIPLVLILMGLIEFYHTSAYVVHGLGIALTLGRLLHAWGFARSAHGAPFGRAAGMALTWLALLASAIIATLIGLGVTLV
jgi:uncharacterized membrane protein YecN with MAPEG domain